MPRTPKACRGYALICSLALAAVGVSAQPGNTKAKATMEESKVPAGAPPATQDQLDAATAQLSRQIRDLQNTLPKTPETKEPSVFDFLHLLTTFLLLCAVIWVWYTIRRVEDRIIAKAPWDGRQLGPPPAQPLARSGQDIHSLFASIEEKIDEIVERLDNQQRRASAGASRAKSGSTNPGSDIRQLVEDFRGDRAGIFDRYQPTRISMVPRSRREQTPLFREDSNGRFWLIELNGGAHAVVPHPRTAINPTVYDDAGLGEVFRCDGYKQGKSYSSFTLVRPAEFQASGDQWMCVNQGVLSVADENE